MPWGAYAWVGRHSIFQRGGDLRGKSTQNGRISAIPASGNGVPWFPRHIWPCARPWGRFLVPWSLAQGGGATHRESSRRVFASSSQRASRCPSPARSCQNDYLHHFFSYPVPPLLALNSDWTQWPAAVLAEANSFFLLLILCLPELQWRETLTTANPERPPLTVLDTRRLFSGQLDFSLTSVAPTLPRLVPLLLEYWWGKGATTLRELVPCGRSQTQMHARMKLR